MTELHGCCRVAAEDRLEAITTELAEREALMSQQLQAAEEESVAQLSVLEVRPPVYSAASPLYQLIWGSTPSVEGSTAMGKVERC